MTVTPEKQAVSPDGMVFCPLQYRFVALERCLECGRLVRRDDQSRPRYVVCDARVLDRRQRIDTE